MQDHDQIVKMTFRFACFLLHYSTTPIKQLPRTIAKSYQKQKNANYYCQNLNNSRMTDLDQEIDPLEISFSNEKGFEPSTPSQGSPPPQKLLLNPSCRITNPFQLFDDRRASYNISSTKVPAIANKVSTPTSRTAPKMTPFSAKSRDSPRNSYLKQYEAKFSSVRKRVQADSSHRKAPFTGSNWMYQSVMLDDQAYRDQRIMTMRRWQEVDVGSHLREITRLNDLINRVDTHVGVYSRLYPVKRI